MRSLVLLPWVLPGVVAAILWRFMYDPQLGLINSFLISLGLVDQGVAWLADPSMAMAAAIVAAVWKGFPFSTVVYLAALQNVDQEQIEAATIDGAGPVRRLFDVVHPGDARGRSSINMLLTTILTFNYFDMIWVLTRGGPQNATAHLPDEDLRARLRPVPLRRGRGLRRVLDRGAGAADHALLRRPGAGRAEGDRHERRARRSAAHRPHARSSSLLAALILLPFFWMVRSR